MSPNSASVLSAATRAVAAAAVLGALLFGASAGPALAAGSPSLSPSGVGVLKIGMTTDQASGALPPGVVITSSGTKGKCLAWEADGYVRSGTLFAVHGRLAYISGDALTTTTGIKRGSSAAALRKAYGPHLKRAGARPGIPAATYTNYVVSGPSATSLQFSVKRSTGKVGLLAAGTNATMRASACA